MEHQWHQDERQHGHEQSSEQHAQHMSDEGHDSMPDTDHTGHAGHAHHVDQFRRLFWIMLVLAVPVVVLDPMFAHLLGYHLPDNVVVGWIPPLLGTVLYAVGGRPFLTGAIGELRSRKPGMMLLIGFAITVAFVSSWGAFIGILDSDLGFWWELALLVVIMLLGHWIEMGSLARSGSALESLASLLPDEAQRVTDDDRTETVPVDGLRVGDVVLVRPGSAVPADGTVLAGEANVDESMVTGESTPVRRGEEDRVVAGTIATDSALRVRVTATGEDTALAGIRRLVADAQSSSSRAQRLADRAAGWLFWFALGAAVITAVVWLAVGQPDQAVVRVITVLVIACPHALGLAIPLVVSIATERAARGGVLVTDRLALEGMRTVDTVLFDKTGTLTRGEPELTGVSAAEPSDGSDGTDGADAGEDHVLALAAAAESDSEHPLARAIVAAAQERDLDVPSAADFHSSPAVGVRARVEGPVDGQRVEVGGPGLLEQHGLDPLEDTAAWRAQGASVLHVLVDGQIAGALALADGIRPESRQAIDALHAQDIQVGMITGDAEPVAQAVADELGIDRVIAGVRPEDKAKEVQDLQSEGRTVAMVGDGVNDAPALATADVGLAIGAGTDVAIGSAGVVLASSDPRSVLSVLELSRATYRKMLQNLGWAAGYNLIAVPLAAGVLAPIGFVLPMSVGAILMSASTVVVALNAQLLRRVDLSPEASTERATT